MEKLKDLWTRQTKERRELEEKQSELKTQLLAQLKEAENELAEKHRLEEKVLVLEQEAEKQKQKKVMAILGNLKPVAPASANLVSSLESASAMTSDRYKVSVLSAQFGRSPLMPNSPPWNLGLQLGPVNIIRLFISIAQFQNTSYLV